MEEDLPPAPLPNLSLHDGVKSEEVDPVQIVTEWLAKIETCLKAKAFDDLSGLFIEDCWWRDIIGLSWDWTTKHGRDSISEYSTSSQNLPTNLQCPKTGGLQPAILDMGGLFWVQGGFSFKHPHGEGKGFVRLANTRNSEWKAWTVFTQLLQLDFQKELETERAQRIPTTIGDGKHDKPTLELQVLVIGAATGQAGLAIGAHLKNMGIRSLLLEKSARVGDTWRKRYSSVALHTPRYTDYYPFLKTPDTWPRYLRQDKIADFMEHYSQLMELDIMLNSTVTKVECDEQARMYYVQARTPSGLQMLTARHVVFAAGLFSDKGNIPDMPGRELFQGQLNHSKDHYSASQIPDLDNKKVVVIGDVTMIQRSPIISISLKSQELFLLNLWDTEGISTEEADVIGNSLPTPIVRTLSIGMTQMMCAHDKDMIDGLKKAGLAVRTGDDGIGLAEYQLVSGGQFYIDQGASQMIIDGRIKIRRSEGGVKSLHVNGLTLYDDTSVDADVVVLATGFHRSVVDVKDIMGEDIAKKVGRLTRLDKEQERIGTWRPTGMPGFWYMTGSFLWCRQYSLALALQIAAVEHGFNKTHYEDNATTTPPTVAVLNGTYYGVRHEGYGQDFFLGMPYAQPPIGDLRLGTPQSLNTTWTETRNATQYGAICIGTGQTGEVSEDCLSINIIRPTGVEEYENLPVAVWIYGGGFVSGGSAMQQYNLSFIVDQSVQMGTPMIAVSLNYRLHCWGYMWSREILEEGVANLGFRDQRLALHWIQENIAAFGGDPAKVTIWGESAGGHSVGIQLTAYGGRDDGLFRAAISQSGAPSTYDRYQTTEDWQPYYDAVVDAAGCSSASDTLACLRMVDTTVLTNIFANDSVIPTHTLTGTTGPQFVSVIDGDLIQGSGTTQLRNGQFVKVPYLIGGNADEGTSFSTAGAVNTTSDFLALVESWGVDNNTAQTFAALYPDIPEIGIPKTMVGRPPPAFGWQYKRSAAYGGDINIHAPRRLANQLWAAHNTTSYSYWFNVVTKVAGPNEGVPHAAEVPFVFDNVLGTGYDKDANVFLDKPETFNPNHYQTTETHWPEYRPDAPKNMVFDVNTTGLGYAADDLYRAEAIAYMSDRLDIVFGHQFRYFSFAQRTITLRVTIPYRSHTVCKLFNYSS
ncbi:flavin-binding monooxygenase [Seiridium cupressi]